MLIAPLVDRALAVAAMICVIEMFTATGPGLRLIAVSVVLAASAYEWVRAVTEKGENK